jgi:methionyl-tRNA formyltransferase
MPGPISIIFCGTPDFAVPSLEALIADSAFSVDLVITQPDKPVGRKQELRSPAVKIAAEKHGITMLQPEDINAEVQKLSSSRPDFLIVVAYGQIFSRSLLELPKIAPVNLHASLLPRWRGASPIHHAILKGDSVTGVTVQQMAEKLDSGPILAQEKTEIRDRETVQTLHDRLATMGADLLVHTLKHPLHPKDQNEKDVTICHKLKRETGIVNPTSMTAEEIDRHVRALVPWPGVTMNIESTDLKILETSLVETAGALPVECKGSTLFLVTVQEPGKKPMTAAEWKRGRR